MRLEMAQRWFSIGTVLVCAAIARGDMPAVIDAGDPYTYGGHTYYMLQTSSSWTEAEAAAVTLGGHLVTINDAEEDAWLFGTFGGNDYALWIGINDVAEEGTFVWAGGDPVVYTNWAPTEPGAEGSDWDYVNIHKANHVDYPGKWNDWPNGGIDPCYGIVEIPDPATLSLLALGGLAALRRRK